MALSYIEADSESADIEADALLTCWLAAFQSDQGCLLLDYARRAREFRDMLVPVLHRVGADRVLKWTGAARSLVEARLALLNALLGADQENIGAGILRAVELYDAQWAYAGLPDSAFARLPEPLPRSNPFRDTFTAIAASPRQRTPGLLAVRDTIGYIYGELPQAKSNVTTWVLLVAQSQRGHHGVLGRLVLERIEPGLGTIYPHPCSSGYLAMDETFREGLGAATKCAGTPSKFDIRFSLRADDVGGLPVPASGRFAGHSAEVAFACALRALAEDEQLDQHVAVTAAFKRPLEDHSGWELDNVGGVEHKLSSDLLKHKRINEVVVASSQRELEWLSDRNVSLLEAGDFEAAWQHLSRFRRITRLACSGIANKEAKGLAKNCGEENQYIPPPILRWVSVQRPDDKQEVAQGDFEPLTVDEVEAVVMQSGPPGLRTYLFADSELAENSFLLHAQQRIAEANDGRVPVLVGQLYDFDWRDRKRTIESLADDFRPYLRDYEPQPSNWLTRLIENGEAVFLFEASEETISSDGLGRFIEYASRDAGCPVLIVSAASHLLKSNNALFFGGAWQTLCFEAARPRFHEHDDAKVIPLQVLSIDVQHFPSTEASNLRSKGTLGKQWFTPRRDDNVQIDAKLSRPAYAYLVAFRPDGAVELCFPDDESTPPILTDEPCYPFRGNPHGCYRLNDGAGLWVFAVLASTTALPPWRDFIAARKPMWSPQPAARGGIWWFDGDRLKPLFRLESERTRGKGQRLSSPLDEVLRAATSLKGDESDAVAAIGFGAGP